MHRGPSEPTPRRRGNVDTVVTSWGTRRWATAVAGSVAVALLIGLPTEMIPNPVFTRPLPVLWWNYPVWIATAALSGLLLATYVPQGPEPTEDAPSRRGGIGGLLAFFAVGCPVCNKVVVLALGTSGAMTWFAPLQPVLAITALVLLAVALRARFRGERACPVPVRRVRPTPVERAVCVTDGRG
jgi:hypothetical protein